MSHSSGIAIYLPFVIDRLCDHGLIATTARGHKRITLFEQGVGPQQEAGFGRDTEPRVRAKENSSGTTASG
jgi:hypothetical protein